MKRALLVGMGLVLVGGVLTPVVTPTGVDSASAASRAPLPFDFDGDGYADLAVGVPGEKLRGKPGAGAVQVLYGSASGVTAHDQLWHQGRRGVKGALEKHDSFGQTLASADFDSDGFADLAIGIPREDIAGHGDAGAVQVLYGGPAGLTASGDQVWHQGKRGVPGKNEGNDQFGGELVTGDFDGDGFADLAIGVPGEAVGSQIEAGAVVVLRGSGSGLRSAGAAKVRQGLNGLPSQPHKRERFGGILAAGDVDDDGRDELAVLVVHEWDGAVSTDPGEPPETDDGATVVHLISGGPSGLIPSGSQYFAVGSSGLNLGWSQVIAMADLNNDGRDDLALAGIDLGNRQDWVAVLHGHADGVHPAQLTAAGQPGVDGVWTSPFTPAWGLTAGSLAAGDLTGDGHVDLALGVRNGTSVAVLAGTGSGLGASFVEWPAVRPSYRKSSPGEVRVSALSGGSHAWLIVSENHAPVGSLSTAGAVGVQQGTAAGTAGPVTLWHQDSPGIKGKAEMYDRFGTMG